jgi:hypothetical protein
MSTEYEGMGLTAEEIAALQEPDGDTSATQGELEAQEESKPDDKQTAAAAKTEGEDDDDEAPKGDDAGAAAAADDTATAAAPAAEDKPADAKPDAKAEASAAPQQAPILVATAPADAEAKLAEIASKRADLRKQYDAGDITFDEYDSQKDVLAKDERAIERALDKAQIAADLNEQQRRNEWQSQCDAFLTAHPEYDGGKGERFDQMNGVLKAIAVVPENANKTGPQLLEMAHKITLVMRGEEVPAGKGDKPAAPAAKRAEVPKPNLPPDLGKMPAASGNDPGEGKWASLDRLQATNPEGYEAALAKMSDSEREAYLAD